MADQKGKLVHCRYAKCMKLHDSTELKKEDAVQGGRNSYYHPDCYHMTQSVAYIKDIFVKNISPAMTSQQIGSLISVVNNIVFEKGIDIDYLKFAVEYFIKYKPGSLKYPFGLHYIIQDKDVVSAWEREQKRQIMSDIKKQQEAIVKDNSCEPLDLPETKKEFANRKSLSYLLGGVN